MMDDTVLSLKTQLLEREREIVSLKKKLVLLEKVCNYLCKKVLPLCVSLALWYLIILSRGFDASYYVLLYEEKTVRKPPANARIVLFSKDHKQQKLVTFSMRMLFLLCPQL